MGVFCLKEVREFPLTVSVIGIWTTVDDVSPVLVSKAVDTYWSILEGRKLRVS
jgi:hypothetical protein